MPGKCSLWAAIVSVMLLGVAAAVAADVKTLELGSTAPDFNLPGVDGKNHALKDFAPAKVLVVVFTCNHCPTAQAYEQRIIKLYDDYKDKGVALVAINPNNPDAIRLDELGYTDLSDSFDEMKIRAKERGFKFPYLYDGQAQKVSRAYGVQATPHVFIFDQDRKLRYVGRIDDSEVKEVHKQFARDAIEALLAGKPVPEPKTHVIGCSTKWIEKNDTVKKALEQWEKEPVTLEPINADGVKKLAANDSPKLRMVNVWATWCAPCVAELPQLVDVNRMYRGRPFEFITLSMDGPDRKPQAMEFLKQKHVSATNYLFDSDDRDALIDSLDKKWEGPVPYTILIAPGGKVIYRHQGPVDLPELKKAIVGYLGRTYASK